MPGKDKRIFFGIQPDDDAVRALLRAQAAIGADGRAMAAENLHLTVAFLGSCDGAREACAHRAALGVRGEAFRLRLDRCGHFERPRIVHIFPQETPPPLLSLHRGLCAALRACDFRTPRAFKPHLTLFRGVTRPLTPGEFTAAEWTARSFCMVESRLTEKGARYTTLHEYPLT
ncbi:MAG: RNA 2',3'-cyclic phosphodiesterase [Gammaproteobacteria bacterium]|nr:RNA 2',3'-cyclic phosphodiesterase [Gammaproteobacteria bacterium]